MSYRLWVLVAGLISYTGCLVWVQDPAAKMIASMFCAFVIGIGIVLVEEKFDKLEERVKKLEKELKEGKKIINE